MTAETHRREPDYFGPILLIGAGLLFLLSNLGVIDVDFFDLLARFWPLLLIAAGVNLIAGRRAGIGALLGLLVVAFLLLVVWQPSLWSGVGIGQETQAVQYALGDATQAEVHIEPSINTLHIESTPNRDVLVEGQVSHNRRERIVEEQRESGGTVTYTLRTQGNRINLFPVSVGKGDNWDLRLNSQVPTALYVDTGVGAARLDLQNIQLTKLDVNTGVGEAEITLPGRGDFDVNVDAGVGSVVLRVPDSLGVRIQADAGLGSVSVPRGYSKSDDVYLSPNFGSAEHRAEVSIHGGVGSIDVVQTQQR